MAFPTSPVTFTSFANGALSDAAQVTAIYTEVEAIETGYLTGTARLNSSHSTAVALSVSGGSTLATLNVTGGSTFAVRPLFPTPDAVGLAGSTTQLAHNSTAAVLWPTQVFATNSSIHSTATNPERLTPQSSGLYAISATLRMTGTLGSTGITHAWIEDSSGGALDSQLAVQDQGPVPTVSVYATKYFDVVGSTQWLRVVALQTGGSSNSLRSTGCFLRFHKVG